MKREYELEAIKTGKVNPKELLLEMIAKVVVLDAETDQKYHDKLEIVMEQFQKILDEFNLN